MITAITIDRSTKNYAELLDILELLGDELGSATNAAVQCIRSSQKFRDGEAELKRQQNSTTHGGGSDGGAGHGAARPG